MVMASGIWSRMVNGELVVDGGLLFNSIEGVCQQRRVEGLGKFRDCGSFDLIWFGSKEISNGHLDLGVGVGRVNGFGLSIRYV